MSCQSQSNPHNIDLNVLIAKYQELINLYNILKSKVSSQCCKKKTEWGNIIGDIYDQDDLITLIESLEVDCQDIKDCLGISNLGDPDKYLNEQGTWQAIDLTGTPTEILYYDNSGNIVSDNNFYRVTTGANPNTYIKSIDNNSGGYSEIYAGSDYLALYNDWTGIGDGGYLHLYATAKLGAVVSGNFNSYLEVNSTNFSYINIALGTTLLYPNADGNSGDVLTTDGAGGLTFQPIPTTPQYITAIANTNTVDLTETAGTLTADVNYQNTSTINLSEDASGLKADLATGAAAANLGYTPEDVANKATNFTTLNNTLYPSTQAVDSYIKETGYPVFFGKYGNTAAGTTEYVTLSGLATVGTATNRASAICNDYTVARLTVYRDNAQPGTGSFEYTLFVNGVASALKVTVAAGSAAGSFTDTVNTVNVSSGDILVIEFKNNAATQSQTLGCSIEFRRR